MVDLLPDAEQVVSNYLQHHSTMRAQVSARTYTIIPDDPTFPLLVVKRVGGSPVGDRPLYHDRALIQADAYGDTKKAAQTVAETARFCLASTAFIGQHTRDGTAVAVVTAIEWGAFRWLPDPDYTPARARYSFDFAVHLHAVSTVGS